MVKFVLWSLIFMFSLCPEACRDYRHVPGWKRVRVVSVNALLNPHPPKPLITTTSTTRFADWWNPRSPRAHRFGHNPSLPQPNQPGLFSVLQRCPGSAHIISCPRGSVVPTSSLQPSHPMCPSLSLSFVELDDAVTIGKLCCFVLIYFEVISIRNEPFVLFGLLTVLIVFLT